MKQLLFLVVVVGCANPSGVCDEHAPTETRTVEIGNLNRSLTELPFVPYEDEQVVLKEYGSQAATHLPIFLRVPARAGDGDANRCIVVEYARDPAGFSSTFSLELERRDDFWVTRLGVRDVMALGEVVVDVTLIDATFEGSATIELEAVEPIEDP